MKERRRREMEEKTSRNTILQVRILRVEKLRERELGKG